MNLLDRFQSSNLTESLRIIWDLIILNLLWLLCCIPVITIGPATCSLFAVAMRLAKGEPVSVVRTFFHTFRENFWQGIVIGAAAVLLLVIAVADALFALNLTGAAKVVFLATAIAAFLLSLTVQCYVSLFETRFVNTLHIHFRNSFIFAFGNLGKTILVWISFLVLPALVFAFPMMMLKYFSALCMLFGLSLPAFIACKTLKTSFESLEPSTSQS